MPLTVEQIQLFRHNGFLKLPVRFPEATVTRLTEKIADHIQREVAPVMRDRQGQVTRISNLWDRDELFRETLAGAELLDALEAVLGPNIEFIKNRHNHATLRLAEDGADYMHRDILQWSRPIVTVLFYLEEATVENGCTRVVPGSHLLPSIAALRVADSAEIARSGILEQAVPVPMAPGELLLIDSLIIHGPGINRTPGTRLSMTAGYHSVDELAGFDNPRRVLVRGERVYMGNDRKSG